MEAALAEAQAADARGQHAEALESLVALSNRVAEARDPAFALVFECVIDTVFVCCVRDKTDYQGAYMSDNLKEAFGFNKKPKGGKGGGSAAAAAARRRLRGGGGWRRRRSSVHLP